MDERAARIEAALERAAIMEYDGGIPRGEALIRAADAHGVTAKELREAFARLERARS